MVIIARVKHPIPSRTRQLSTAAPMVLRPKAWESRSSPSLEKSSVSLYSLTPVSICRGLKSVAGWSSPVARQAHNLKVVGSNPTPATTFVITPYNARYNNHLGRRRAAFRLSGYRTATVGAPNLGVVNHLSRGKARASKSDYPHTLADAASKKLYFKARIHFGRSAAICSTRVRIPRFSSVPGSP